MSFTYFLICSIVSFIIGFILSSLINSIKNENKLFFAIENFKKSIDDYKNQSIISTKEVKDAMVDAQKLARALTTNQNLKGQFAEDCLEEVLIACNNTKNINYIKQYVCKNEDDKEIKPDYLIKLPDNKCILIDCKLTLDRYIEYKNKPDKFTKQEFIKDLNNTINTLSNKKYQTAQGLNQPDFILMYIPIEAILTEIYTDKDYIQTVKSANEKNIIIVGNSSIITTIKLTRLIWAKNIQDKNTDNIISLAQTLYDLIAIHSNNLYELKSTMEDNLKKINKEYSKITDSKFFKTVEQLKSFGIEASKKTKKADDITINSNFLE